MALSDIAEVRVERLLGHTDRLRREDTVERRAPDAAWARVIGARRDQDRAAIPDIARDVLEIGVRQNTLPCIAIEDDELKLIDLLLEQFARRKCDQRQF